jgi:hypothetical protein
MRAIEEAYLYGGNAVGLDNFYWGCVPMYGKDPERKFPIAWQDWTAAFVEYAREAGILCHRNRLKLIVNIGVPQKEIGAACADFSPYVDGLMTEMAFHPEVRNSSALLEAELAGYEYYLKNGNQIYLVPFTSPPETPLESENYVLRKIKPLFTKYGNIHVCGLHGSKIVANPLYWLKGHG